MPPVLIVELTGVVEAVQELGGVTGIAVAVLAILFALLGAGIYIGLSLLGTGALSLMIFRTMPVDSLLGQIAWNTSTIAELVALPLDLHVRERGFSKIVPNLMGI